MMAPSDKGGFDRRFFKSQEYLSGLDGSSDDNLAAQTVSMKEAIYYSRRLQLQQRGVPFHEATRRAMRVARHLEIERIRRAA